MASLNHADAIIFDLRDNSGGFPDMVSLIASYLFDHPEYMYSRQGSSNKGFLDAVSCSRKWASGQAWSMC